MLSKIPYTLTKIYPLKFINVKEPKSRLKHRITPDYEKGYYHFVGIPQYLWRISCYA